jgi:hypothetical protein
MDYSISMGRGVRYQPQRKYFVNGIFLKIKTKETVYWTMIKKRMEKNKDKADILHVLTLVRRRLVVAALPAATTAAASPAAASATAASAPAAAESPLPRAAAAAVAAGGSAVPGCVEGGGLSFGNRLSSGYPRFTSVPLVSLCSTCQREKV